MEKVKKSRFSILKILEINLDKNTPAGAVLQTVPCPSGVKNFCIFEARHRSQTNVSGLRQKGNVNINNQL